MGPVTLHISAAGTALLVCIAGGMALLGHAPSEVVTVVVAAFVPYAGLAIFPVLISHRRAVLSATLLAAASGAALVVAPPLLSDDLFRYLWDGRVSLHGIDPYRYAPADPALADLRDGIWARVNHPDVPTIYPPVSQLFFAAASAIGHTPVVVKLGALLAHLATIPVVAALAGKRGPRAAFMFALNPLALTEAGLSGHVDAAAGLFLAACVWGLVARRPWVAALSSGLAAGTKLVGLLLVPLVARDRRAGLLALSLCVAALVPLLGAGGGEVTGGLGQYARRWRGNEGPFVIVEAVARAGVDVVAGQTHSAPGHIRLPLPESILEELAGTPLDPRATLAGEKKAVPDPRDFPAAYVAALLARALVVLFVLGLAWTLMRRRVEPRWAARWVVLAGLLLAPQVHPWYLLWLLPLEIAAGGLAGVLWSLTVLVAYIPLDRWVLERVWIDNPGARVFEYGVVLLALLFETPVARRWLTRTRSSEPKPV